MRLHYSCLRHIASRTHVHACYSSKADSDVQYGLRALLRETAQPVAVVTSLMPLDGSHPSSSEHTKYHGATLSSFTSIALAPHPLVAFSLRIPSRMATSLKDAHNSLPVASHMVVNILSAAQVDTAVRFSRADLYPDPFADTPYHLSQEGLPVLGGSLGALSCKLIAASWPLHDLKRLEGKSTEDVPWEGDGVASELFIAQVTRVESLPDATQEPSRTSPLLYYHRGYSTTREIPPRPFKTKS